MILSSPQISLMLDRMELATNELIDSFEAKHAMYGPTSMKLDNPTDQLLGPSGG